MGVDRTREVAMGWEAKGVDLGLFRVRAWVFLGFSVWMRQFFVCFFVFLKFGRERKLAWARELSRLVRVRLR